MTQPFPEVSQTACPVCGAPLDEHSRFDRFGSRGSLMLAVHGGAVCGFRVHSECVDELRGHGQTDERCPCGRGPVDDGIDAAQAAVQQDSWPEVEAPQQWAEDEEDDEDDQQDEHDDEDDQVEGPRETGQQEADGHEESSDDGETPTGETQRASRDHRAHCSECKWPMSQLPRSGRSASDGFSYLVVQTGTGEPCGCRIHQHCLLAIQEHGATDTACLCGAGPLIRFLPEHSAEDPLPESVGPKRYWLFDPGSADGGPANEGPDSDPENREG
jgi:hypothetical protein